MQSFFICGGNKLMGELEVQTSKNAVLPILAGCILCDKDVVYINFQSLKIHLQC